MSNDQKKFLLSVAVGTATLLVLSGLISNALKTSDRNRIIDAEQRAADALSLAYAELRSSGDPDTRLQSAIRHGRDAESALRAALPLHSGLTGLLMRLSAFLPFATDNAALSSALSLRVRSLNDALGDISAALPGLRRLAGYDARADIQNAADNHDLYIRLYTARDGMRKITEELSSLPNSARFNEARIAVSFAHDAFSATEPLLLHLGGTNATPVDTSAFVAAAAASALHAQRAVQVLLSDEHLSALAEMNQ